MQHKRRNDRMPIITVEELKNIQQSKDITIVDVRSHLTKPHYGKEQYDLAHIPGAFFLDMEEDLSSPEKEHGGRHPLPNIHELAKKLGDIGVDDTRTVVFYDDGSGAFASRAWWILHDLGHKDTMILEGGIQAWRDNDNDVTDKVPRAKPVIFTPKTAYNHIVTMQEVKERDRNKTVLIDSRSFDRYQGEIEPLYHKAGHIPGARHYFWKDVLTSNNVWKDQATLRKQFAALEDAEEIIVSCGSGISACPNIVALKRAGFTNVKLYPGSFSDWISYDNNDVQQGVE